MILSLQNSWRVLCSVRRRWNGPVRAPAVGEQGQDASMTDSRASEAPRRRRDAPGQKQIACNATHPTHSGASFAGPVRSVSSSLEGGQTSAASGSACVPEAKVLYARLRTDVGDRGGAWEADPRLQSRVPLPHLSFRTRGLIRESSFFLFHHALASGYDTAFLPASSLTACIRQRNLKTLYESRSITT